MASSGKSEAACYLYISRLIYSEFTLFFMLLGSFLDYMDNVVYSAVALCPHKVQI